MQFYIYYTKKIYHRDIKPGNIIITGRSDAFERLRVPMMKLIDFGNVTDLGEVPLKEAYNKFSGTAYYLSPFTLEIEKGMTPEDLAPILKANDYWAMAQTFVKYMTGKEWTDLLKYKHPEDVFLRNTNSYIHDRLMLWTRPEEYIKDDCKYRAAVIRISLYFLRDVESVIRMEAGVTQQVNIQQLNIIDI